MKVKGASEESLFNEFIKEGALKPGPKVEVPLELARAEPRHYKLPPPAEASEDAVKAQWRGIRNYFRTGEKGALESPPGLAPVLIAPYFVAGELPTAYPVFLPESMETGCCSFSELFKNAFKETFKEGEAPALHKHLPVIEKTVRERVADAGHLCPLDTALEPALKAVAALKINGEDKSGLLKDLEKFRDHLPGKGKLVGFSQETPVIMLAHLLQTQYHHKRIAFVAEIQRLKSGLRDLLAVEKSRRSGSPGIAFADPLIEFKALEKLKPGSASEPMSGSKSARILGCLKVLDTAEELLLNQEAVIYIGKDLAGQAGFRWKERLRGADVHTAPLHESCAAASAGYSERMTRFTRFIAAVRIAGLELDGSYDEEIHDEYFTRFNWRYFTDDEAALCPPVVLIEETRNLLGKELPDFSSLIASNKPVKVLAVNKPLPLKVNNYDNEADELLSYQLELGALTIAHRNAFVHQSAAHDPMHLLKGYESGLAAASPALFHVLVPAAQANATDRHFLEVSAAVEGRRFPLFTYNAVHEKWGSRFDLGANPQPEKDWPDYPFEARAEGKETEKHEWAFTLADYFAINSLPDHRLPVVPPACWTDDLVPLNEYLEWPADKAYAKVPFIWLADPEKNLYKAAVPYSLVVAARERLDFWRFIQELGGIKNFHVEQAVDRTRRELNEQKDREAEDLQNRFRQELEEARAAAAGEAMHKLASMLLDLEDLADLPAVKPAPTPVAALKAESSPATEPAPEAVKPPAEEEAPASGEPWIDTFRCTSCNECTDKFPRAFKYNEDKQAYVDDPTTITFAQLVKVAEACPAKCIHPGMPLNPGEPGLDELIMKAKRLN